MAVRFEFKDGRLHAIVADAKEEVAWIWGALANPSKMASVAAIQLKEESRASDHSVGAKSLSPKAQTFIQLLADSSEGIPSTRLAESLHMEPRGLGSIVPAVRRWAREQGVRGEIVTKVRWHDREKGKWIRGLKLEESVRKRIKNGELQFL